MYRVSPLKALMALILRFITHSIYLPFTDKPIAFAIIPVVIWFSVNYYSLQWKMWNRFVSMAFKLKTAVNWRCRFVFSLSGSTKLNRNEFGWRRKMKLHKLCALYLFTAHKFDQRSEEDRKTRQQRKKQMKWNEMTILLVHVVPMFSTIVKTSNMMNYIDYCLWANPFFHIVVCDICA